MFFVIEILSKINCFDPNKIYCIVLNGMCFVSLLYKASALIFRHFLKKHSANTQYIIHICISTD